MKCESFDLISHQFSKGATLIEASAGTGKTYSIAFMVLRLVVEKKISIDKILVVTFTKAATEELRERVRERLYEAREGLINGAAAEVENSDPTIAEWIAKRSELGQLKDDIEELTNALSNIDQAAILTIHGFCNRVLSEYPLESGQPFKSELSSNISAVSREIVEDFWRRNLYQRSGDEVSAITKRFSKPEDLMDLVRAVNGGMVEVVPKVDSLDVTLKNLIAVERQWREWIKNSGSTLKLFIEDALRESWIAKNKRAKLQRMLDAVQKNPAEFFAYVESAFLKSHKARVAEFIADLQPPFQLITQLNELSSQLPIAFKLELLKSYSADLESRLDSKNMMGYDDLIKRLADALTQEGSSLVKEVGNKYRVALIDEFQDTDAEQWSIFSTLFLDSDHYLYLIGDPKQSIYRFRGADIHAYLRAKSECSYHYTLTTNWRSTPLMVEAVNTIFTMRDDPFQLTGLDFNKVSAGKSEEWRSPPLLWWELAPQDGGKPWNIEYSEPLIRNNIVSEIVSLLNGEGVKAQDIAILVDTNWHANEYKDALALADVPSITNTKSSVFQSREAKELWRVMVALEQPRDLRLAKQALSVSWFGLDGESLVNSKSWDLVLERWLTIAHDLSLRWQNSSFIAVLYDLLQEYAVVDKLSIHLDAERRITNIMQLLELMQQEVLEQHLSIKQTVSFLALKITDSSANRAGGESDELRLERDAEAVQIVTMHSSKGLQYKIVFCPFLWKHKLNRDKVVKVHSAAGTLIDLGSDLLDERKKKAQIELDLEALRIAYVAVTRAESRCYLVVGDGLKDFHKSALGKLLNGQALPVGEPFQHKYLKVATSAVLHTSNDDKKEFIPVIFARNEVDVSYRMTSFSGLDRDRVAGVVSKQSIIKEKALLPKGAHFGNLIHDLLENIPFSELAISLNRELLKRKCQQYGVSLEDREDHLEELLIKVVTTPLSNLDNPADLDFTLSGTDPERTLKEMSFFYSIDSVDLEELNRLLLAESDIPFQPIQASTISGYLNGFIDLVCEHNGRFFIMDYKSNFLGNSYTDYGEEAIFEAMREHNYGLQFTIYSMALHQYLLNRDPDYSYEDNFGGVKYLFVRGMDGESCDNGIFNYRASEELLNQVQYIFNSNGVGGER